MRAILILLVAIFSVVGCETDGASTPLSCDETGSCIRGTISKTDVLNGPLFQITNPAGRKYCVARERVSVDELGRAAGEDVVLTGRFEPFVDFDDCAYLQFGESLIPCGVCGAEVFIATSVIIDG